LNVFFLSSYMCAGMNVLCVACATGNTRLVQLLKEHGAQDRLAPASAIVHGHPHLLNTLNLGAFESNEPLPVSGILFLLLGRIAKILILTFQVRPRCIWLWRRNARTASRSCSVTAPIPTSGTPPDARPSTWPDTCRMLLILCDCSPKLRVCKLILYEEQKLII
jgi:hypothetical protein